jgi:hypothetical protein
MNQIKYLFVLFILLQYSNQVYSQEITFYYDKIADSLSYQPDGDQLLEKITRQIWYESSSSWVDDSLYEYSYNNKNLLDTFTVHKRNNSGVLENTYQETYDYISNDRISFSNQFTWSNGHWSEYNRYYYSYYGNGNLALINGHTKKENGWLYVNKKSYYWDVLNDTVRITFEALDIFYGIWRFFWKEEFSYDSLNSLIKKEKFEYYSLNIWRPEIRNLYFYDNNGNNNENIRQEWNNTDSSWVNDYRYLYEYDLNNVLLSIVYQDWQQDSLDWKNVWRETYTYTPQNNIDAMFKETWTPVTGWSNYVLRNYYYDVNYNWTEKLTQLWDGSTWKDYYRHLATWQQPVSVIEETAITSSFNLFQNYPNPFNPSTKIKFTLPDKDNPLPGGARGGLITLKVYDILGNEIITLVNEEKSPGTYELEFDGSRLTSGMYFYTLKAGGYLETKKMILLK